MPINYLQLQGQIHQYGQAASRASQDAQAKLEIAMQLLNACAQGQPGNQNFIRQAINSNGRAGRTAMISEEAADAAFDASLEVGPPYTLLASDGSQIIPDPHDALTVALVNISTIMYTPNSQQAPQVSVRSHFIKDDEDQIVFQDIGEERVNLERDVEEMRALADATPDAPQPVIALRDGALELFHEPRQSQNFEGAFRIYLQNMDRLRRQGAILAGYIDKPRADLVVSMLPFTEQKKERVDLSGLSDLQLFAEVLKPGQRSALFELVSSSSAYYRDQLRLFFFYINVSQSSTPWIARVELPAWVAGNKHALALLQQAILDQCRLMGQRPYPYLLHRAHEEALVSNQEKDGLISRLAHELGKLGMEMGAKSHKLNAKELQSRKRTGR